MPRCIPENWSTLYVRDLGIKGTYPQDLRIFRKPSKSTNIYAKWMPLEEEDTRSGNGRVKGTGKRTPEEGSLHTQDAEEAAIRAVAWWKRKTAVNTSSGQTHQQEDYSLHRYWDGYFKAECRVRETKRNFKRWRREELLKWNAPEYGISNQSWAQKSADQITRNDFKEYFALLETRARKNSGSNGSGIKADQKTLIRKLLALAEDDFLGRSFPSFPKISKQPKEVQHLTREQWNLLRRQVFELGEGMEDIAQSPSQYDALPFNPYNRKNCRNWVDLHDALMLEWFFFLRAEDMYRLRSEWFKDKGEKNWICNLETTKKDRPLHQTFHYRSDADGFLKRIKGRKPKGYLVLPHKQRPIGNEAESSVLLDLNYLLKVAIEKCLPDFPKEARKWTTIRHTAFRLTLEEVPSLGVPPKINAFAENGHTSPKMLWERYLKWIDLEKTAQEAKETIKPSAGVRWGGKFKSKKDLEEARNALEESIKG